MGQSLSKITDTSKTLWRSSLGSEQTVPKDSLFVMICSIKLVKRLKTETKAMVIRDIALLIVSSAQNLATPGATKLEHLTESVNEGWNSAIPVYGPRP